MYNGHKRVHSLKFQSVNTPDGIIVHMSGPWTGRRHDSRMLRESGLLPLLEVNTKFSGERFVIYGDPTYGLQSTIVCPFKGTQLTAEQMKFNCLMSRVRVSVEWCFGAILQNWAFVDLQEEPEGAPPARWEDIHCCRPLPKSAYVLQRKRVLQFFRLRSAKCP